METTDIHRLCTFEGSFSRKSQKSGATYHCMILTELADCLQDWLVHLQLEIDRNWQRAFVVNALSAFLFHVEVHRASHGFSIYFLTPRSTLCLSLPQVCHANSICFSPDGSKIIAGFSLYLRVSRQWKGGWRTCIRNIDYLLVNCHNHE